MPVTYPARVLNTAQEECPSDDQRETVRAEVGQDLRSILQSYLGETSVVRVVHCNYKTLLCSPHPGIVCPNLTNPENGQVVQALDGNVPPGTVANYSCDADYVLFGNVSRECVRRGQEVVWTGEAPTCRKARYAAIAYYFYTMLGGIVS